MSFTYTDYHLHQFDRQFSLPLSMPSPTSCWYLQRQDVQFGYSYPDPEYTVPRQIAQPHPPTCWDNPWQQPQQYQHPLQTYQHPLQPSSVSYPCPEPDPPDGPLMYTAAQPSQPPSPPYLPPYNGVGHTEPLGKLRDPVTANLEPNLQLAALVSQLERLTADVEQLVSQMDANKRCLDDPHAVIQPPLSISHTTPVLCPLQQPTAASPAVLHQAPHHISMSDFTPNSLQPHTLGEQYACHQQPPTLDMSHSIDLSPYSATPYAVQPHVPQHTREQLGMPLTEAAVHVEHPLAPVVKLKSRMDDTDRRVGGLHAQPRPPPAPPNGQLSYSPTFQPDRGLDFTVPSSHMDPFMVQLQSEQVVIVNEKLFGLHRYSIDESMILNGNCGEGDSSNSYSRCLLNKYDEEVEVVDAFGEWSCSKCIRICNCIVCITKKSNHPTNTLIDMAKKIGLSFVSVVLLKRAQYLSCEKMVGVIVASPQKKVVCSFKTQRKDNYFSGKVDLNLLDYTNEKSKKSKNEFFFTVDVSKIELSNFISADEQIDVDVFDPTSDYVKLRESILYFQTFRKLFSHLILTLCFYVFHGVVGAYVRRIFVEELGAKESSLLTCAPNEDFGRGHPDHNLTYARELVARVGLSKLADNPDPPVFGVAADGDVDYNIASLSTSRVSAKQQSCTFDPGGSISQDFARDWKKIEAYGQWVLKRVKMNGVETFDANAMLLSLHLVRGVELNQAGGFVAKGAVMEFDEDIFLLCSKELTEGMYLVSHSAICVSIKIMFEEIWSILKVSMVGAEAFYGYYGLKGANGVNVISGVDLNFSRLGWMIAPADVVQWYWQLTSMGIELLKCFMVAKLLSWTASLLIGFHLEDKVIFFCGGVDTSISSGISSISLLFS